MTEPLQKIIILLTILLGLLMPAETEASVSPGLNDETENFNL